MIVQEYPGVTTKPGLFFVEKSFQRFILLGGPVRVALTSACQAKCYFCHLEGQSRERRRGDHLTTQEFIRLLHIVSRLGFRKITLTGGDPFAFNGICEILNQLPAHDVSLQLFSLTTNGIALSPYIDLLPPSNLDQLTISLHSLRRDRAASILGVDKLEQVKRNVYKVVGKIRLVINTVLNQSNQDEVWDFISFSREVGATLKLMDLMWITDRPKVIEDTYFRPSRLEVELDRAAEEKIRLDKGLGVAVIQYRIGGVKVILKDAQQGFFTSPMCTGCSFFERCGEGIYSLRVLANGELKPCLLRKIGQVSLLPALRSNSEDSKVEEEILDTVGYMMTGISTRIAD